MRLNTIFLSFGSGSLFLGHPVCCDYMSPS